jgi:hypothetical protein
MLKKKIETALINKRIPPTPMRIRRAVYTNPVAVRRTITAKFKDAIVAGLDAFSIGSINFS